MLRAFQSGYGRAGTTSAISSPGGQAQLGISAPAFHNCTKAVRARTPWLESRRMVWSMDTTPRNQRAGLSTSCFPRIGLPQPGRLCPALNQADACSIALANQTQVPKQREKHRLLCFSLFFISCKKPDGLCSSLFASSGAARVKQPPSQARRDIPAPVLAQLLPLLRGP